MGFSNVAPKKEMFFIYHFPKEYVGRSIQNAVNTKLYINSKILRAVYLYSYTTGCLCLWNRFLVQSSGWSYSFLRKFAIINEAFLFCYISFKIRQSFFDIKEFLKNLLHIMDLCFQVVVKEVLLITMLTIKTYLQLITIRSKEYLQFTSIKHSFQLIMTIKITVIMMSITE